MSSFESFDFDANPYWQAYLNSVEIVADPISARSQLHQLKQKWYKIFVVRLI